MASDRKQARAAALQSIQKAARPLFEEGGFAATSIEKVARQASISVGAVYLYFKSKEDLYASLVPEWIGSLVTALDAAGGPNGLEKLWAKLWSWQRENEEAARAILFFGQPGIKKQLNDTTMSSVQTALAAVETAIHDRLPASKRAAANAKLVWTTFLGALAFETSAHNLGEANGLNLEKLLIGALDVGVGART